MLIIIFYHNNMFVPSYTNTIFHIIFTVLYYIDYIWTTDIDEFITDLLNIYFNIMFLLFHSELHHLLYLR